MIRSALIVAAAPQPSGLDRVAELAAEVAVVIGVDGGASACLRAGVVPGVVVGDLDSLSADDQRALRAAGSRFLTFPADKDLTDLDLALVHASEQGVERVIVTGCTSGRLDHTLAAVGALARAAHLRPHLAELDLEGWILAADHANRIELSVAGSTFSVVGLLDEAIVSVRGAKWPLNRATLRPLGSLGVSNVVAPEGALVTVHSGVVAVLLNPQV